jgi:hypothetical protein
VNIGDDSLAGQRNLVSPSAQNLGNPIKPGGLTDSRSEPIKLTLDHVCGNRQIAAEMLGISLRTLQNRIAASREKTAARGS